MFSTDHAVCKRWLAFALATSVGLLSTAPAAFAAPENMNLTTTSRSVVAPVASGQSVAIRTGDHTQLVNYGARLTPAQAVAVQQILTQGTQSLILGTQGNAVGGNFALPSSQALSSLIIPANVTATTNFASGAALAVTGNITNAGNLLATTTNSAVTEAIMRAMNISNLLGGRIAADSGLNLTLSATKLLSNDGTIIANNDLKLISGGGVITNSGLVQSTAGNITLETMKPTTNLTVKGAGGTFSALNGVINIRDAAYAGKANVVLAAGNYLSQALNVNAGNGKFNGSVGDVTGVLNVQAGEQHFYADTANLVLGKACISGDPTIFNTGNISLTQSVIFGEDISIIAGGDITSSGVIIQAYDGTGQGHDITLIAGANISPVTAISPLTGAQTISVNGPSLTGGNISLGQSLISADSGIGDKNGGKVTLIAFASPFAANGGIENLAISTHGSGKGNNGDITIYAGGALTSTNNAIDNVVINSSGGGGIGASVKMMATQPIGSATFNAQGVMSGAFNPSLPTTHDIQIDRPISIDGGSLTVTTGGIVNTTAPILTAGALPGRNGGDVTIDAATINIGAAINASGSAGANGATGGPGLIGAVGQGGGNGGRIALTGKNGIVINADILTNGGAGGNGGNGGNATKGGQAGGAGAVAGGGGSAGSVSFSTTDSAVTQQAGFIISAAGGLGGNGGNGGLGFVPGLLPSRGSDGGDGGSAANGGSGGMISALTGKGALTFNGSLNANGGAGGGGGAGKNGTAGSAAGGDGGDGGAGGLGGGAGLISFGTTDGAIVLNAVDASGGNGGLSGTAGDGAAGKAAGDGGSIRTAGSGGDGGMLNVSATNLVTKTGGDITFNGPIHLGGGVGASQNGDGGDAADGATTGGIGGSVFDAGAGGGGGSLTAKSFGAINVGASVTTDGGDGGEQTGRGGAGGDGALGGAGGGAGKSGDGGKGGSISLTSTNPLVVTGLLLSSNGGNGGENGGLAANGGAGTTNNGGAGGKVLGAGKGGGGGMITLTVKSGGVQLSSDMQALGGAGGDQAGTAGDGGNSDAKAGGAGGSILNSGDGGAGGRISVEGTTDLVVRNIFANGGAGGAQISFAGDGGDGKTAGGAGGSVGNSGSGGGLGAITLKTNKTAPAAILLNGIDFRALGGSAGAYESRGGDGGNATAGFGGAGGSLGSQGSGGQGGAIFLTANTLTVMPNAHVFANGGSTPGFSLNGLPSGSGGNGGGTGNAASGGDAGRVGDAGSGGKGGLIWVDAGGDVIIDSGMLGLQLDSVSARGGNVGNYRAVGGSGGNAAVLGNGDGGDGGAVGKNGSGGGGGSVSLNSDAGMIYSPNTFGLVATSGGYLLENTAVGGKGGNAGMNGIGGAGGGVGDNGSGGDGGMITLKTTSGDIHLGPIISTGGDIYGQYSPVSGDGGNGGSKTGKGGDSGKIGSNGAGGKGGDIGASTTTGNLNQGNNLEPGFYAFGGAITPLPNFFTPFLFTPPVAYHPSAPRTGNGGNAVSGAAGNSGSIGTNGHGGEGGTVIFTTGGGVLTTPKGITGVSGGDGGTWAAMTGNGGSTLSGKAGNSGSIGSSGSGGNSGNITLTTKGVIGFPGDVVVGGVVLATGGSSGGNFSVTGNGGTSLKGDGGSTGDIGIGGSGGLGGTIIIDAAGSVTSAEAIVVQGGNANFQTYAPLTGNGGNGTTNGGSSGTIMDAGSAGNGGTVKITANGIANLDRIDATGGVAGSNNPLVGIYKVAMNGQTGSGGTASAGGGGSAGRVGNAADGGSGGYIEVNVGMGLQTSVGFRTDGGWGGDQAGLGGAGGTGTGNGGNGGDVGNAGKGGRGGVLGTAIKITVTDGDMSVRDLSTSGGDGGLNQGRGGAGGDSKTSALVGAGSGGDVGAGGAGGDSGTADLKILNLALANVEVNDNQENLNAFWDFHGGAGGANMGVGGKGGNSLGGLKNLDGKGGDGGMVNLAGAGGDGGTLKISAKLGSLKMFDALFFGGRGGDQLGTGGDGGIGTGTKPGGFGGSVFDVGSGGDAGSFEFSGDTMLLRPKENTTTNPQLVLLSMSGGATGVTNARGGNGGQGGAAGGAGGDVNGGGLGGKGGSLSISANLSTTFDRSLVFLNGGDHLNVTAFGGNGGKGGNAAGADGGAGGGLLTAGQAGNAGTMSIKSLSGDFTDGTPAGTGTGFISADGGNVFGSIVVGGNGGNAGNTGVGGLGGSIAGSPTAGDGSLKLDVNVVGNIAYSSISSNGGSTFGFSGISGRGGDGGLKKGGANNGGAIGNVGSAGSGGSVTLNNKLVDGITGTGNLTMNALSLRGGSVGVINIKTGDGGNSPSTVSDAQNNGGQAGVAANNGSAGKGGGIKLASNQQINAMTTATDVWDVSGGNVGDYIGQGGNGGKGAPATGTSPATAGGSGGGGGILGNNGTAGDGGKIDIEGTDGAVNVNGILRANGGNVGRYTGLGGNGGDGGASGGGGGSTGDGGGAGGGGILSVTAENGAVVTQALLASGGSVGEQLGKAGTAGTGTKTGGPGGSTGNGAAGGGGGNITVTNKAANITISGDVKVNGTDGADNSSVASAGSDGVGKGGNGGSVGNGGDGGKGGSVMITSESGDTNITGDVTANDGAGGAQHGKAGAGGIATTTSTSLDTGIGGAGGSVGFSGTAGLLGINAKQIQIDSGTGELTITGSVLANGNNGGINDGSAGDGGKAIHVGGAGGSVFGTGFGSGGGLIKLSSDKVLTVGGSISSNGGKGGDFVHPHLGKGGIGYGPKGEGGDGGSTLLTGFGGNGGTVVLSYNPNLTQAFNTPSVTAGAGGLQILPSEVGQGGQGTLKNGEDGKVGFAGVAGQPGTVVTPVAFTAGGGSEFVLDTDED